MYQNQPLAVPLEPASQVIEATVAQCSVGHQDFGTPAPGLLRWLRNYSHRESVAIMLVHGREPPEGASDDPSRGPERGQRIVQIVELIFRRPQVCLAA